MFAALVFLTGCHREVRHPEETLHRLEQAVLDGDVDTVLSLLARRAGPLPTREELSLWLATERPRILERLREAKASTQRFGEAQLKYGPALLVLRAESELLWRVDTVDAEAPLLPSGQESPQAAWLSLKAALRAGRLEAILQLLSPERRAELEEVLTLLLSGAEESWEPSQHAAERVKLKLASGLSLWFRRVEHKWYLEEIE